MIIMNEIDDINIKYKKPKQNILQVVVRDNIYIAQSFTKKKITLFIIYSFYNTHYAILIY